MPSSKKIDRCAVVYSQPDIIWLWKQGTAATWPPRVLYASRSVAQLSATPWTVARQGPLSMGILQARILEWVAMPSSRGSSRRRDQTRVSCVTGRFFTVYFRPVHKPL